METLKSALGRITIEGCRGNGARFLKYLIEARTGLRSRSVWCLHIVMEHNAQRSDSAMDDLKIKDSSRANRGTGGESDGWISHPGHSCKI